MKRIQDPLYLKNQKIFDVKEHQIPGLLPNIKTMISLCKKLRLGAMTAPEVGLPYNFFVAENPDPHDQDFDVIFSPNVTPNTTKQILIEERSVNGKVYQVPRYKQIHMTWYYYNGTTFQQMEGIFEGIVCWIAQQQFDRLQGIYVDDNSGYEEVPYA